MKKIITLLLCLFLCFSSFTSYGVNATEPTTVDTDIPLKKETATDPQPRSITFESFIAWYNIGSQILTITGCEYTGSVIVDVIGTNGFSTSLYFDDCNSEDISIYSLRNGRYTLQITTSNGNKYSGKFVL